MLLLVNRIAEAYFYLNNVISDPRNHHLPLVSSPFPILLILGSYLYFVLKWGPTYMKTKHAYHVDKLVIVYNAVQILANGCMLVKFHQCCFFALNWKCSAVDYSNDETATNIAFLSYLYMLIKILDLLDTVFFVLRKRLNQITFLHVYHHSLMIIVGWVGAKYLGGGHSQFVAYVNCIVHVFMYFYYLMSIWNEKYKKSIWWKKHVTQLQLFQFLFLAVIFGQLLFQDDCGYPIGVVLLFTLLNSIMFLLFGNFYWKTYILKKTSAKLHSNGNKIE